jgi:uridine kinase
MPYLPFVYNYIYYLSEIVLAHRLCWQTATQTKNQKHTQTKQNKIIRNSTKMSSSSHSTKMMNLTEIEHAVLSLYDAYTSKVQNRNHISDSLDALWVYIGKYCKYDKRTVLVDIFKTIGGGIMHEKFEMLVSDGKTETCIKETCFKEMFDEIKSKHVHKLVCEKTNCVYKCDYHQESLFAHLHMAMIISCCYTPIETDYQTDLKNSFIALFHDIGKFECFETLDKQKYLSFAYHGETGAGILLQAASRKPMFQTVFDDATWDEIARTISVHMCGYHETKSDSSSTEYKWEMLQLETQNVKQNLTPLSYGDHYGRLDSFPSQDKYFEKSRPQFESFILKQNLQVDAFFSKHHFNPSSMMILVRGMSASGKSQMVQELIRFLKEKHIPYTLVERDMVIRTVVSKCLSEETVDWSENAYSRYHQEYEKLKLGKTVNETMKSTISQSIERREIVIIDSVISMFSGVADILPENSKDVFTFAIDVIRCEPINQTCADRLNIDMKKQIELFGPRTVFNWMHPAVNKKQLTSFSTSRNLKRYIAGRAHVVHVVSWSNVKKRGYDEMFRQLDHLSSIIKNQNNIIPAVPVNLENEMSIVEYAQSLYDDIGLEQMIEVFESKDINVKTLPCFKNTLFEKRAFIIKYKEHCSLWKPKWARQARGVCLFLNDDKQFVCLKYQLPRGAEVMTKQQLTNGVSSTQDIADINCVSHLDQSQQLVYQTLLQRQPIDGTLSFKCDGSLLSVEMYSGPIYYDLMTRMILIYGDDFSKMILQEAQKLDLKFIPVFSTSGTLFASDVMLQYMVTAILGVESKKVALEETPLLMMQKHGLSFLTKLNVIFYQFVVKSSSSSDEKDVMTLSFEAVCQNRYTLWGDLHTELAISYPESFVKVLGLSYGNTKNPTFIPHMVFSDLIQQAGFQEPMFWNVTHSLEIEAMLANLGKLMRKQISEQEFLNQHKMSNRNPPTNQYIDYEGFVFYTSASQTEKYVYSKIKTEEYYKSHHFKEANIPFLLMLSETCSEIFPLSKKIRNFYGNLGDKLKVILKDVNEKLKQVIYNENMSTNLIYQSLPENSRAKFETYSEETKCKIILNVSMPFKNEYIESFQKVFEFQVLSEKKQEEIIHLAAILKKIIMAGEPWKNELDHRIDSMSANPPEYLRELFTEMRTIDSATV